MAITLPWKHESYNKFEWPNKTFSLYCRASAERVLQNFKHIVVKQDQPTYPITSNRSKGKFVEYKKKLQAQNCKSPLGCILYQTVEMMWLGRMQQMLGYAARVFRHCYANIITTSSNGLQLFEGTDEHKLPFHSQQLVLRGLFSMLGQTMAHVITHTHFVIMGLARPVAIYLVTGCPETACAIVIMDNIPYLEIRDVGAPDVIWWEGRRIWSR